jgi:hypothetical protein
MWDGKVIFVVVVAVVLAAGAGRIVVYVLAAGVLLWLRSTEDQQLWVVVGWLASMVLPPLAVFAIAFGGRARADGLEPAVHIPAARGVVRTGDGPPRAHDAVIQRFGGWCCACSGGMSKSRLSSTTSSNPGATAAPPASSPAPISRS